MDKLTKEQLQALKSAGAEYARQEAWDIHAAANAIQQVAMLPTNEADEPMDMMTLSDIMLSLIEFIRGEIKEMESAANQGEAYQKAIPAQVKNSNLDLSYANRLGIVCPDMAVNTSRVMN